MQYDRVHRSGTPGDTVVDISTDSFADPVGATWLKSLRVQIPAVLGGCLLVTVITFGWYNANRQTNAARDTLTTEVSDLARSLGNSLAPHLLNNHITAIETLIVQGGMSRSMLKS